MEEWILIGYTMILTGYEILTVLLPAFITIWIFRLRYKDKEPKEARGHIVGLIIFAIYMFGVFHFTGAGTIFDIKQYGMEFHEERINLIPFSDTNIDCVGYGLNVVLFLPLGFLLPLVWPAFNKVRYACVSGLLISLLVEISQLLNFRSTDIDDLILNTAGAVLGFWIFRLCSWVMKRDKVSKEYGKWEIVIYVLAVFAGHFFLYNELGMARLLFGF